MLPFQSLIYSLYLQSKLELYNFIYHFGSLNLNLFSVHSPPPKVGRTGEMQMLANRYLVGPVANFLVSSQNIFGFSIESTSQPIVLSLCKKNLQ